MHIVFLDEFGHIGPFVSATHSHYRTSPVFGLAGFMVHHSKVRELSSWHHRLKCDAFKVEIEASGTHPAQWEKKGNELFTAARAYKTKRLGFSLINEIKRHGGKLFYNGIEKYSDPERSNGTGLYKSVLSHSIRAIDRRFRPSSEPYQIIVDQHNDRSHLMVTAAQVMFARENGARGLMELPYQVESGLYPTVQMADWIASIVGSLWAYKCRPDQFAKDDWAEKYFETRINGAITHSSLARVKEPQSKLLLAER